ncbi:MAG: M1 family aminopeptidase, partial [Bacteroidota bacterium]
MFPTHAIYGRKNVPYSPQADRSSVHAVCPKYHDLLHTKLEIAFDTDPAALQGTATLQLKPHFYPQTQLILTAPAMHIHSVHLMEDAVGTPLCYVHTDGQLRVVLDRLYTREEPYWVEIKYMLLVEQVYDGEDTHPGLHFVNSEDERLQQIWVQGGLRAGVCWFPTLDAPNQQATQEVYITVEDRFTTLSNGVLVFATLNDDQTRTDYWRMDLPHAPYLAMVVVGEFVETQDEWNDIPVNAYADPAYARSVLGSLPEMLTFFSEKLDYPYPWPSYRQVILPGCTDVGIASTTAVVLPRAAQADEGNVWTDADYEDAMAQALFQHWFGSLVSAESWDQLSLHVSLGKLGAHLWRSYKWGAYDRDRELLDTWQRYLAALPYDSGTEVMSAHVDYGVYNLDRVVLLWHTLKNYLGEAAFFQSLNHYLRRYAFATADLHQLRRSFEEVTGEDLHVFFDQWFSVPGHPVLRVEHSYKSGRLTVKVWQRQAGPMYQLPLEVIAWVGGEKVRHTLHVDRVYQEYTWEVAERPEVVYIDRGWLLLGEIEHPKLPAEYHALYRYGEDFFSRYEALRWCIVHHDPAHGVLCEVLSEALQDDYWGFRVMAAEACGVVGGVVEGLGGVVEGLFEE